MSILKQIKWLLIDQFMFNMAGGGGGNTTTTGTTYTSNIPEYAKPYVMSMLGAGQSQIFNIGKKGNIESFKPYQAYSENVNDYFAGASPMQQQAYSGAANLQLPGQYQAGSQLAGAGGLGSLGLAGQMGQVGNNYFGMATNPGATQAFMNPYLQNALNPALEESRRQYGMTGQQQQGAATRAGAFGGSREALMASENNRNMNSAMNQMIGTGYQNAYDAAQKNMQYGAGLGLQGMQGALQGYGQGIQAAGALGQLGSSQLQGQQNIINMQNQFGGAQQQAEQAKINQAIQDYATKQQYPMMQLANMSNLLHGLPMQASTTQSYAPAPSGLNTLAGLGTGIAGAAQLMKAEGGTVKSYVGGGITSLANRERIAENYSPQMLQKEAQNGVLPQQSTLALTQDYGNFQKAAQAAQAAAQPQQNPGIAAAPTNLPTQTMAQGGIISFAKGGSPIKDYTPTDLDYSYLDTIGTQGLDEEGKPYTEESYAAKQREKEKLMGFKNFFDERMADVEKQKADLVGQKDTARGLALLNASGKILENANKPGLMGIGAGITGFNEAYAPALKDIRNNEALIRKETYSAQDAKNAMIQAQMAGDRTGYDAEHKDYVNSLTKIGEAKNANKILRNTAGLESYKAQNDYITNMDVARTKGQYGVEAALAGKSDTAGEGTFNQALALKAKDVDDAKTLLDKQMGAQYQSALAALDPNNTKADTRVKANAQLIKDRYEKQLSAIYTQANKVHNPRISKIGKIEKYSDEDIQNMLNKDPMAFLNAATTQANAGAGKAGNARTTKGGTTYTIEDQT